MRKAKTLPQGLSCSSPCYLRPGTLDAGRVRLAEETFRRLLEIIYERACLALAILKWPAKERHHVKPESNSPCTGRVRPGLLGPGRPDQVHSHWNGNRWSVFPRGRFGPAGRRSA